LKLALGLLGLACGGIYALIQMASVQPSTQDLVLWIMVPGGVGYYLPKYWVSRRQQHASKKSQTGFPTASI
jgi:tight adherence protein C